jgi:hypothetical protein
MSVVQLGFVGCCRTFGRLGCGGTRFGVWEEIGQKGARAGGYFPVAGGGWGLFLKHGTSRAGGGAGWGKVDQATRWIGQRVMDAPFSMVCGPRSPRNDLGTGRQSISTVPGLIWTGTCRLARDGEGEREGILRHNGHGRVAGPRVCHGCARHGGEVGARAGGDGPVPVKGWHERHIRQCKGGCPGCPPPAPPFCRVRRRGARFCATGQGKGLGHRLSGWLNGAYTNRVARI